MKRDWKDFKALHSNIGGARLEFENACETLYRKVYSGDNVQQVEVKQGDGGIDIYVGELGISPITVIQCKFFLEDFGDAQKSQIRKSFKTAIESTHFSVDKWILCIPRTLDLDQTKWWTAWKAKQKKTFNLAQDCISLVSGNELIDLLISHNLYNTIFQIKEALMISESNNLIKEIHKILMPEEENANITPNSSPSVNEVLFNNYTLDVEEFYFLRDIDTKFVKHIGLGNIWIYGISGVGKTALVNRNLIQNKFEYLYCDFGPIDILTVDDVLDEIISSVMEKYGLESKANLNNKIKELCHLLCECSVNQDVVLVIDELSFPHEKLETDFAKVIIQISAFYQKQKCTNNLKFVISTIPAPLDIIKNKQKASEHFQYLSANNWQEDVVKLLKKIVDALNLDISEENSKAIIAGCDNNPRLLKNIIKKIVLCDTVSVTTVTECIKIARLEYF